jgi:hypothetical protein
MHQRINVQIYTRIIPNFPPSFAGVIRGSVT